MTSYLVLWTVPGHHPLPVGWGSLRWARWFIRYRASVPEWCSVKKEK